MRQDLGITQAPLEQCHSRTFQAVSAGSPPLPRAGRSQPRRLRRCLGQLKAFRGSARGSRAVPSPPRPRCAHPQEACFSQIRDGLRTYHGSLAAVLELLPGHAGLVETLQLDAANLSSNIQQQVRGGNGELRENGVGVHGVCIPGGTGRDMGSASLGATRGRGGHGGDVGSASPGSHQLRGRCRDAAALPGRRCVRS